MVRKVYNMMGIILFAHWTISGIETSQAHLRLKVVHTIINSDPKEITNTTNFNVPKNITKRPMCYSMPIVFLNNFGTLCIKGQNPKWISDGRDSELLRIIAESTNQLKRCLAELEGEDDIVNILRLHCPIFGRAMYWNVQLMDKIDYLYPHAQDNLCLVVQRADYIFRSMLRAFEIPVYFCIILYGIVLIIIVRFICQLSVLQATFETVQNFLTGMFVNQRRHLMIWGTICNIVILNSFSGVFTSYLTIPKRGYEADTLEEIFKEVDEIHVRPVIYSSFFENHDDINDLEFLSHFKSQFYYKEVNKELARLESDSSFQRMLITTSTTGSYQIRQVKECVYTAAYVSYPVRKGWSLAERYSTVIQNLVESGVARKVTDDAWRNYRYKHFNTMKKGGMENLLLNYPKTLSFQHSFEAFIILGAGLIFSACCFITEVVSTLHKSRIVVTTREYLRRSRYCLCAWRASSEI